MKNSNADEKLVLDACCGSRMFWFDKNNPIAVFSDIRNESHTLCDGRILAVNPDVISDFRLMPFEDESFWLVVFDPPHMTSLGANSWMAKKYGRLGDGWKDDIQAGFSECFRVLKTFGTLVFKWNESDVLLSDVLKLTDVAPLFGHTTGRQSKTKWVTFMKTPAKLKPDGGPMQPARGGELNLPESTQGATGNKL